MIIGFNAAAGATFGTPGRIGGPSGFSDGTAPTGAVPGFSGALAQAAAPAVAAGPQGEDTAKDTAAVDTATADTAAVDAAAADSAAVDNAAVDGAAIDGAAVAAVPMDATTAGTVPGDNTAAVDSGVVRAATQAVPAAAENSAQSAATGADLAALVARAAVAPPASQSGARPANAGGENSAAAGATAAGGGALALPETLRPQAPVPVVRAVEAPPLPVAGDPAATLPPATVRAGQPAVPEWSPVKVDTAQAHWGRELMAALAERVEMQVTQQIKQARIRLDPPELGRLQLTVRLDSDRLSVQLNASQPQVREMLALQLDRLRTDLVGQYGERVDVTVGQEQRQQRQPGGEPERQGYGIAAGLDAMEAVEQTDTAAPRGQGWVNALA